MKKLLFTLFFMACGAMAMANTDDKQIAPPPNTEKASNVTPEAKKIAAAKTEKPKAAAKQQAKETQPQAKFCTSVDGSRFGLSVYIAEFVNSSNIRLTNFLLSK